MRWRTPRGTHRSGTKVALVTAAVGMTLSGTTWAAGPAGTPVANSSEIQQELNALKTQVAQLQAKEKAQRASSRKRQSQMMALKAEILKLKRRKDDQWMSQARETQIANIIHGMLKDAKAHSQFLDADIQAGYDNGFFIQTSNKAFRLLFNGLIQTRYTFGHAEVRNATNPGTFVGAVAAAGYGPPAGDTNEVDLRRARIELHGNIFNNVIFCFFR